MFDFKIEDIACQIHSLTSGSTVVVVILPLKKSDMSGRSHVSPVRDFF